MLIVEDDETYRLILAQFLRRSGFTVFEAGTAEDALILFGACRPALVLTDVMLPSIDGVALVRRLKSIDRHAIVIVMTGYGNADVILGSLRAGAVNFFAKPLDLADLVATVKRTLTHRYEEAPRDYSRHLVAERKYFSFTVRDANPAPIINQIASQLPLIVQEHEIINIKVGLEEMILNAIEHGCLRITSEEKRQAIEEGTYGALHRQKLDIEELGSRTVSISYALDAQELRVEIDDAGLGFEWRALAAPTLETVHAYTGRGILLARMAFDEVEYNAAGNAVTLVKRRSRADGGEDLPARRAEMTDATRG
jgi:DNA-binding response OmpR family regulator